MKKINIVLVFVFFCIGIFLFFNEKIFLKEEESSKQENFIEPVTNKSQKITENNLTKTISAKPDSLDKTDYLNLHNESIVIDTHSDFIWKVFDKGVDFKNETSSIQSDLPRLKAGGVDVQVFAVWIPMNQVKRSFSFTMSQINKLVEIAAENSAEFELAKTYDDIIRITNEKKVCGLIGIEGGTAIEKNLDNINTFSDAGVSYIGLTWNNSNAVATSARDAVERGKKGGLTEFGFEVVKRMNETGIIVDVSHLSEAAFWDVIETSTMPVIASHSDCYSINPHYRNLTDEQIKALAKKDGYIGINFYDKFLDKNSNATIENVVEHIDYIKNLVGVDYIGLGADFDGGISPPPELKDASCYPELTKRLVEKGYTNEDIKKILGLNFLRVFKKVCG
ncbi:MAG: dipeptidase [bacterium]